MRGGLGRDVSALSGLLKINGGSVTTITDNSANWDLYAQWSGAATGLNAATGRTSLGLGSAALLNSENPIANDGNLPTGAAVIAYATAIFANQANWNTAYTDRLKWDGGSTGLVAATGRTSLGLGNAATRAAEDTLTNGENLPDGAAITAYVTGLGYITDGNTGWDNSYGFITDGNTGWDNIYNFITTAAFDTSAELAAILTDETGTAGSVVFSADPRFTGRIGVEQSAPRVEVDVNGNLFANNIIAQASATNNGSISLHQSTNVNTGYIQWRKGDNASALDAGTRLGYMGYDATNILLALENGANFVVTGGNFGVGIIPETKVHIAQDGTLGDGQTSQFRISGYTDPYIRVMMGVDTASEFGWIQATKVYSAFKPLILQPLGSNVGVGTSAPPSVLGVSGAITASNMIVSNGAGGGFQFNDRSGGVNKNWGWYANIGSAYLYNYLTGYNALTIDTNNSAKITAIIAGVGLEIADIGASSGGSARILEQRSGTEAYLQISQGNASSDQLVLKSDGTIWMNHGGNLAYGVQQYFASSALPNNPHKISSAHSSSSGAANNLLFSINNGASGNYTNTLNLTGEGRIGVNLSDLPDYTIEAGGDIRANGSLRAQELILDVTSVHPSTAGAIRIYMP
jgi:hypothetical protein